jgi:cysteine-rich repeat protein
MMKTNRFFRVILFLVFLWGCAPKGAGVGVSIACELSGSDIGEITSFALALYNNLDAGRSLVDVQNDFCAGWDQPAPWDPTGGDNPTGATLYDTRTGTSLSAPASYDFEVLSGRWGFTFVALKSGDTRDHYRGCVVADLVEGPNAQVRLRIKEIVWPVEPGVCGDGTVDQDELCDDGNTVDDATCSADCDSMPVFQVNVITPGSQYDPSIAGTTEAYSYVVAWTSSGSAAAGETSMHVRARRFDLLGQGIATGTYMGDADFKLNTIADQSQYQPSVAVGGGRFMTVWIDTSPSTGYPAGDVVWRITEFGNAFTPVEQTLNVDSQAGTQDWGRVAGNGGSKFFAAWITQNVTPRHAACKVYDESWSVEDACSATPSDDEIQVDTAMSFDGRYAAVWTRQNEIFLQLFDASGDRDGEEKRVNVPGAGTCDYPAVAFDGPGHLLVVWRHQPPAASIEIRGRYYDDSGDPSSPSDFAINTTPLTGSPSTPDGKPNYTPDVARDPTLGQFLVVWDAPGAGGGRGRIVLGDGQFGINRFVRATPEDPFTSRDDFPITSQEAQQMDQFVAACAMANFCMVAWRDQSLVGDPDNTGIRAVVVPTLQPE